VFISHGTADSVIPYFMGRRLFAAAREPKMFVEREGDIHRRHPSESEFLRRVMEFVNKHPAER